jgi:plastocyanin
LTARPSSGTSFALVLVVLVGACAAEAPGVSPVATSAVELPKSYRFAPPAISVPVGTTVTWTNRDDFTHSVLLGDRSPLVIEPGARVSETFASPGLFPYICSFHPRDMRGSVLVTKR